MTENSDKYAAIILALLGGVIIPILVWRLRNHKTAGERALEEIKELREAQEETKEILNQHVRDDIIIQQKLLAEFAGIKQGIENIQDGSLEFRRDVRTSLRQLNARFNRTPLSLIEEGDDD